jgi:hypothetical protein
VAGLSSLSSHALQQRWKQLYNRNPPSHTSRTLLIRAVAYRLQENASGGLKPQVRRMLAQHSGETRTAAAVASPRPLSPGTRLVREWQGATYQVVVLDDGVLFRGRRYSSLSEVARTITGSRWSGPRFFGLTARNKDKSNGKS